MRAEDINSIESESGIIATLIQHPDFVFHSENLLPNHFSNDENKCVYTAIRDLAEKGIFTVDPYNIIEDLNSSEGTRRFAEILSIDRLNELMEMSDVLARHSVEEYKMLVENVLDAAFRRDAMRQLDECKALCADRSVPDVEQRIYEKIDGVMLEFSSANEVPQFKDVVDDCWGKIKSKQGSGYSGIPFKFKTLNEYVTIEPGELVLFAAGAKQGKSIMLLNCAVDLLRQDKSVLYIDSELNTTLFTARLLAHLSGVEFKRVTCGNYDKEEAGRIDKALAWLKTRRFTHIYMPIFDQQSIYTTIKKVNHTQGIDVLIVDYFKGSGQGDAFNSYQELGRLVDCIKNDVCGSMQICGLGAAQTTESGRLADSSKIARNASTIILLQEKTPEEIEMDGVECGNKKMRVVFNRNGMQHASGEYIDVNFNGNLISYEEARQHIPIIPY